MAWAEGDKIHVSALGRQWLLARAGNLEDLWENMGENDFTDDERLPYWTELWPASLALAHWLNSRKRDIARKPCLDLGCGLGFTAIIGQCFGAEMWAVDYDLQALDFCMRNARLNHVEQPAWICMDWRKPAFAKGKFWRIWAGDILYEKRFMNPIADFLEWTLAPEGAAWFAEPGRKVFNHFIDVMKSRGWSMATVSSLELEALYPQDALIGARIWEIRPPRALLN